ncbi:MAG: FAD-dependent oxidoreductase, partial [Myxococcota bacterium]
MVDRIHDDTLYDAAVIGSGFGGLAAALTLAEHGERVVLFERLNYPGGCASTFTRKRHKFESGATLFSGFGPGQVFHTWMRRHDMDVAFEAIDPLVELRAPAFTLRATRKREELLRQLLRMPGAPTRGLVRFFDEQKRVADMLWELFDDPSLLPPFGLTELARHAARLPRYASLLPLLGKPLSHAVERWGAGGFEPLRIYLDAICQITVQASASQAEAPFAIGAMDYYYRGTGHIHGGIGELAWAMVRAIERAGGVVHMTDQVRGLERRPRGWSVISRRQSVRAKNVVANLLPQDLWKLLPDDEPQPKRLGHLTRRLKDSWG